MSVRWLSSRHGVVATFHRPHPDKEAKTYQVRNARAFLEQAFEEAVDDYLETCARLNRAPQKPYSGKLSLRLDPALHASVAVKAELSRKSINQWVADVLSRATHG